MKYLSVNYNMQILFQGVIYLFGNIGKDPETVYPNCWTCYCSNQVKTPFTAQLRISLLQKVVQRPPPLEVWRPPTSSDE